MTQVTPPVTRLAPRERRFVLLAAILYAGVAVPVGVRRGGDLEVHFEPARQWVDGSPLYGRAPRVGAWWPPFAVALVAPFALEAGVSVPAAKAAWAVLSVAAIAWSITRLPRDGWRPVCLAVAAVAAPLNRNFEDLNMNAFLLVLLIAAARDLEGGRERRAGAWMGVAAALKVFPVVWLGYLAFRRRWQGLAVGMGVAAGLTMAPLLRYGWAGGLDALRDWAVNSAAAQALGGSNQSLAALATRLHLGVTGAILLDLACAALVVVALRRPKNAHEAFEEVALVAVLAVLVSPIAWVHYFLLLLPAWVIALTRPGDVRGRGWYWVLLGAGLVTSGIATVWSLSLRDALFGLSWYTWGALLLLVFLACAPRDRPLSAAPA